MDEGANRHPNLYIVDCVRQLEMSPGVNTYENKRYKMRMYDKSRKMIIIMIIQMR